MATPVVITIRALDKTAKAFGLAKKGLMGISGALINVKTALVGVVGAAGFGALIKQGLAAGDSLAKTADKIGVTTEALAGLRHAAELTGVSTETMDMALQRFTRRASEAANGTGEAVGALRELGLNANELNQLPLDEQMEAVADAMGGLEKQSDRVRIAMKLFDSEGVALVNTLGGGSDALREMIEEAEHLGLTLSRTDTAQIEAANDAFTRAKGVLTGLSNQLAVAFAPILQLVADTFRQSALDSAEFGNVGQRVADSLVKVFAKVQGSLHGMRMFVLRLRIGFTQLGSYIASKLAPALQTIINIYNKVAAFLGKPLIDNPIQSFAEDAKQGVQQLRAELEAMQAIDPSANILEAYELIKLKSRETAEQIAADKAAQTEKEKQAEGDKTQWQLYQDQLSKQGKQNLANWEAMNNAEKTKNFLGAMTTQLQGMSKHSKKVFALQKTAAIAQAVMDTYAAVNVALKSYKPPVSYAFAALSLAQGMGNVASIRSQSFEGGGFTGHGSRTGGVDGKGGFPAILHPNETVIDHTKGRVSSGGKEAVVVNQTINVTTGVQQTVRAEINNLMPEIAESAQNAVLGAVMQGGGYSDSLRRG